VKGDTEVGQGVCGGLGEELKDVLHVIILIAFKGWIKFGALVVPGCKGGGSGE
jgi:hypothetical protein